VNTGEPVYLTKNGYGAMVVLSLEVYSKLVDGVENILDEEVRAAEPYPSLKEDTFIIGYM
jgi:PHD/YefM family antitoxin component YafN of YafNO toxin-antitoxin module